MVEAKLEGQAMAGGGGGVGLERLDERGSKPPSGGWWGGLGAH